MAYPTDHLTKSDVPFAEDGRRHGGTRFGLMLVSTALPEARYGSIVEVLAAILCGTLFHRIPRLSRFSAWSFTNRWSTG